MRLLPLASILLALVACSNNREPKAPVPPGEKLLLDRIDALEADMATLQADMQELRARSLPIAEMSDDDFERHVQMAVAAAPSERREAVEKELRAARKSARLEGKALSEYWDERFEREAVDKPWAEAATASCKPKVEKSLGDRSRLTRFECRHDRCRAEFDAATAQLADDALAACTDDTKTFGGAGTTRRITASNGRVRAVFYLVRPGASMNVE